MQLEILAGRGRQDEDGLRWGGGGLEREPARFSATEQKPCPQGLCLFPVRFISPGIPSQVPHLRVDSSPLRLSLVPTLLHPAFSDASEVCVDYSRTKPNRTKSSIPPGPGYGFLFLVLYDFCGQ